MKANPADKVQHWEIDKLIPYARNSRTHSDEQVSQIAASMKEWGVTSAVLVDEEGGIIAGHGRVMAAKKLGMTTLPVMVASGWTDVQKKAFVIADNKLALNAGWDAALLSLEFDALKADGFDIGIVGFNDQEMKELFHDIETSQLPELDSSEDKPLQQMTFIVSNEQAEEVKRAIDSAIAVGSFDDNINTNRNGNALARICETYLTKHG